MTTVAHVQQLLTEGLRRVTNVDAPFLDKAQRLRLAEEVITGSADFLAEIVAAHPEECAGHWPGAGGHTCPAGSLSLTLPDGSQIDAVDLAQPGVVVGVLGEDFDLPEGLHNMNLRLPALLEDEIDEDPAPDPEIISGDEDDADPGPSSERSA